MTNGPFGAALGISICLISLSSCKCITQTRLMVIRPPLSLCDFKCHLCGFSLHLGEGSSHLQCYQMKKVCKTQYGVVVIFRKRCFRQPYFKIKAARLEMYYLQMIGIKQSKHKRTKKTGK